MRIGNCTLPCQCKHIQVVKRGCLVSAHASGVNFPYSNARRKVHGPQPTVVSECEFVLNRISRALPPFLAHHHPRHPAHSCCSLLLTAALPQSLWYVSLYRLDTCLACSRRARRPTSDVRLWHLLIERLDYRLHTLSTAKCHCASFSRISTLYVGLVFGYRSSLRRSFLLNIITQG